MPKKTSTVLYKQAGKSNVVLGVFMAGLIIFLIAAFFGWQKVLSDPKRVFTGMLENSFRTQGVAKQVNQDRGNQSLNQVIQLQSGEQNLVQGRTTLKQSGDTSAVVVTENIGTPFIDYVRYSDIQTNQKNTEGQPLDFTGVLNMWGKSENPTGNVITQGEQFGEAMLGVVPIGYVSPEARKALLGLVESRNIYAVDYGSVKRETNNGRPQYMYSVQIKPEDYVSMLKEFARAVGLNQLETLNATAFQGSPPLAFEMTVDVWSRQLTGITFKDSGRVERYSSYGIRTPITVPEAVMSVEALQERLQSIQ